MVAVAASGPLALAATAAGYVAGSMNGRDVAFEMEGKLPKLLVALDLYLVVLEGVLAPIYLCWLSNWKVRY